MKKYRRPLSTGIRVITGNALLTYFINFIILGFNDRLYLWVSLTVPPSGTPRGFYGRSHLHHPTTGVLGVCLFPGSFAIQPTICSPISCFRCIIAVLCGCFFHRGHEQKHKPYIRTWLSHSCSCHFPCKSCHIFLNLLFLFL